MKINSFLSAAVLAVALLLGAPIAQIGVAKAAGSNNEVRIQTRLAGGAINGTTPSGAARFRAKGGASNFSVEVEDVNLANGSELTVTLTRGSMSIPAGKLTVSARIGEIDVNTKDGDLVPQAKAGDVVIVSDASGKALLSGVLQ